MDKKFKSFIQSKNYKVGFTGRTVYVYDKNDNELTTFKDLTYAYNGVVSPNEKLLVIKSTDGRMAVYSLESLQLIKKFRFSKVDGAQDHNFIFSADGKYLFNIENHIDSTKTALSIYNTQDFSLYKRILQQDDIVLDFIEYDKDLNEYFILGFFRDLAKKQATKNFVAKLVEDNLQEIKFISEATYFKYAFAKIVEFSGFTQMAYDFTIPFKTISLKELSNMDLSLSSLWKEN